MANRSPEQDLIDGFISSLSRIEDADYRIQTLINSNCKAKKFADIEYVSHSGQRWAIEAKSNDSKDAHNSVHKIFGELLKETGRNEIQERSIGILIPLDAIAFYSRLFQAIDRDKFIRFGTLIPVKSVFAYGDAELKMMSWPELYDAFKAN
ncbi:hypothetical protein C9J01_24325 [Photobacterium rosenbergii]|uniref:Restriction endonuclease n=1 Tax=Photobacterium rosenbergii TaxID=294936 RepID=A0A2T3N6G9_9GAMM|nr:hypothetical protein [Photobacterium rosenbergii]PSW08300.1 hypothetical protein C9J01_24325 [Photobacterium rosenbergii]